MSVFDRLTNTASPKQDTSVYNRLVGSNTPTTTGGSVYDRLIMGTVSKQGSVYDRLMPKPNITSQTSTQTLPPAKVSYDATPIGIGVNTVLGIPKAVWKIAKTSTDWAVNRIARNLEKQFAPMQPNETPMEYVDRVAGPAIGATDAEVNIIKEIAAAKNSGVIAGFLKKMGILEKDIPALSEKLATISEKKQVANEINNSLKQSLEQSKLATKTQPTKTAESTKPSIEQTPPELQTTSVKPSATDVPAQVENSSLQNTIPEIPSKSNPQITEDINKYIDEQIAQQNAARETGIVKGIKNKATNLYNEAKRKLVDFAAPIEDVLRTSTKKAKISILPSGDITDAIDRVLKTPTMAGQFARNHGLDQVIKIAPNLNRLDQYMIAKQAIAVDTRGIATGRNIAKDTEMVKSLAPQYEALSQKVTAYTRDLLNYAVDSGLVSKETADMLVKRYPDYVPLNRIFSETEKGNQIFGSKAIASLGKQTVVQTLKGSSRTIESPIKSILERTADAFKQGERNKAAKILASYEKIPGNPFQLRELSKVEKASGKNTITFFDNGVKRTFETTKEVADAARNMNSQQLNSILRVVFGGPTRLLKIGTTGINMPFIASNIAKDQVTALINSKNALKTSIANPAIFLSSLWNAGKNALKHGELFDEMLRNGALGTSFDISRNEVAPTIEKIRASRSVGSRIKYTITHPGELLRAVENILGRSEELTRIQQYTSAKQVALKEGWSAADAEIIASRAARENTVNFARRGEWGQIINAMIPYSGAGIQGSRTFVRSFRERPIQTATKLAFLVFTPVALTTAWNLSDQKRKEAYDDIADYEKQNNIVLVPPNPTKNSDGTWNVIKIPLSQEVNNLSAMIRRPIEAMNGKDPVGVGEIVQALIGSVEPVTPTLRGIASASVPQTVKPSIENIVNKNLFTGLPIVPDTMSKLSPALQYKPYTSGTARLIGKATNISPLQIEAFIKGTLGGVGSQVVNIVDNAAAGVGIIPKDQIGGQNVIKAIVSRFASARGGQSSQLNNTLSKMLTAQADDKFLVKQDAEILYTALKALPKEQAIAKFNEVIQNNPNLAKAVNSIIDDEKLGLSYADRMLKTLEVNNGNRARYIADEFKALKTDQERAKLWEEYVRKKIITKQIASQLSILLKNK